MRRLAFAVSETQRKRGIVMLDVYRNSASKPALDTGLRMSASGVLAERDLRREPGWIDPHWTVIRVPAGDIHHYCGQHLVDAAVACWSVLVREATP